MYQIVERLLQYIKGPVGQPYQIEDVEKLISDAITEWEKNVGETKTGFINWLKGRKADLVKITYFLLGCLDVLIVAVEDKLTTGADKKATVLYAIEKLYDHLIRGALPIWLLPFSPGIKAFIIYTIISAAIDFIVAKYNEGEWKKQTLN